MAHDWRDLFSKEFLAPWERGIEATHGSDSAAYMQVHNLMNDVWTYHDIPKTDYDKLEKRRKRLKEISKRALRALKALHISQDAAKQRTTSMFKEDAESPAETRYKYEGQSLGRTLLTIAKRAARKAEYLKILKKYYSVKKNRDGQSVRKLLARPRDDNADLLELHPGVRLEQLDPVHRGFELTPAHMEIDRATGDIAGIHPIAEPNEEYAQAFRTWFNKGPWDIPFFVYLEGEKFCTGDDKYETGNHRLKKVQYCKLDNRKPTGAVGCYPEVCTFRDGTVWSQGLTTKLGFEYIADTAIFSCDKGKGAGGFAAYVFSEHFELFIGRHQEMQWHHSSFLSGSPVRCAGMIKIHLGKVKCVSGASGHYRPSERHLKRFVKYLYAFNVLAADCVVRERDSKTEVPYRQYVTK